MDHTDVVKMQLVQFSEGYDVTKFVLKNFRNGCFTTTTFQNCLRNLLLDKESEFYQELVDIIGKKR